MPWCLKEPWSPPKRCQSARRQAWPDFLVLVSRKEMDRYGKWRVLSCQHLRFLIQNRVFTCSSAGHYAYTKNGKTHGTVMSPSLPHIHIYIYIYIVTYIIISFIYTCSINFNHIYNFIRYVCVFIYVCRHLGNLEQGMYNH